MFRHFTIIIIAFIIGVLGLGILDAERDSLVNLFSMLMGYVFGTISEKMEKHK